MKTPAKKRVIVSVTNDLVTDNRVFRVCSSLAKMEFDVLLVGRKLPGSPSPARHGFKTKRMSLLFKKGPLFYAEYNLMLFLFLLFAKSDILLSNDLDTLLANYLASVARNKKLVFDSHEYFTEVPELVGRPRAKRFWKRIERWVVPKLKYAYTVCDSIAGLYFSEYGVKFSVVRNIPEKYEPAGIPEENKIKTSKKIILYQGAVNIGRGLPQVISAMQFVEGALLVIVGTGDIISEVKKQVSEMKLEGKVLFAGRVPANKVRHYTAQAGLGLSIEEDMGLNYRFALPNKLFDYIRAQVPVMVSNLPEMAKLVGHYQIGLTIDSHEPEVLAVYLKEALGNEELREKWRTNLKVAASELTWENEEKTLGKIFGPLL